MKSIKIRNWEEYKHYKDRRPKWIKLHIEAIEEFDENGEPKKFYRLPDSAKLTFFGLLCLQTHFNNQIPFKNKKWLKEKLGINKINLQPLIDAGFITIDGVSEPYQSDTDGSSKKDGYSQDFLDFWKAYPRKEDKGGAYRKWKQIKPSQELQEKMIKAVEQQTNSKGWQKEGGQYIPHPRTWLHNSRWEDELKVNNKPVPKCFICKSDAVTETKTSSGKKRVCKSCAEKIRDAPAEKTYYGQEIPKEGLSPKELKDLVKGVNYG